MLQFSPRCGVTCNRALDSCNILTRAPAGGGGYPPPLRFFEDSEKTAARSGAKFCIAVPSSFIQVP